MARNRLFDIFPGALPVGLVNETLGLELEEGDVKFSAAAQRHAHTRVRMH